MRRKIKNKGKLADSSSALEIQKQKMKSIATPKLEVDLSNQILISSGIDAIQKFNQLSKGKSAVEPSNDNTDQMDVDAMAIHFSEFLTFAHAAFHWIAMSRNHAVMVSFSILNEVHGEIPLPEEFSVTDVIGVTLLDGMLSLHSNRPCDQSNSTIKLWVLKEYGIKKSWIPFLSIEDPYIVYAIPKYRFPDGELLFRCFVGGSLRTRSGPFGAWPEGHTLLEAHPFTESLISPRSPVFGVQCDI
ncbi:uncharacterized protein [Solanum lycopersicum]|uniref:uncharacterized protein isoform X2 n=1 Tax=Solanum lycopersicum TaxID=4081 RepID=UPI000532AF61|nr:uncharacterized protein LOC101260891 isoform X2 [Solanum lycopersicum]